MRSYKFWVFVVLSAVGGSAGFAVAAVISFYFLAALTFSSHEAIDFMRRTGVGFFIIIVGQIWAFGKSFLLSYKWLVRKFW